MMAIAVMATDPRIVNRPVIIPLKYASSPAAGKSMYSKSDKTIVLIKLMTIVIAMIIRSIMIIITYDINDI